MTFVKHFAELRVYDRAFDASMRIFELSKSWPPEERYSLTDQIRRSSRSVCGSIAEAWRKRRYPNHFVSKLSDADGEVAETENWLRFAHQCGYLQSDTFGDLWKTYENIAGGLVNMMTSPEKWCGPAHLLRESVADYIVGTVDRPSIGNSIPPHSHTHTPPYK